MFFTNLTIFTPPHDIHGWKATDLSLVLAPSDQNLMHPTSRQNFGDGPRQTPKLILTLCLIIKWTYAYNWQKETIFCLREIFPQKSCKYIWVIASIMISSSAGSKLLKIPFDSTSSPALKVGTIWISHCDFLGFQKASRKKNYKQEFMALCQKLFWSCLLCKNI